MEVADDTPALLACIGDSTAGLYATSCDGIGRQTYATKPGCADMHLLVPLADPIIICVLLEKPIKILWARVFMHLSYACASDAPIKHIYVQRQAFGGGGSEVTVEYSAEKRYMGASNGLGRNTTIRGISFKMPRDWSLESAAADAAEAECNKVVAWIRQPRKRDFEAQFLWRPQVIGTEYHPNMMRTMSWEMPANSPTETRVHGQERVEMDADRTNTQDTRTLQALLPDRMIPPESMRDCDSYHNLSVIALPVDVKDGDICIQFFNAHYYPAPFCECTIRRSVLREAFQPRGHHRRRSSSCMKHRRRPSATVSASCSSEEEDGAVIEAEITSDLHAKIVVRRTDGGGGYQIVGVKLTAYKYDRTLSLMGSGAPPKTI